ncbi:MAG TPA: hypothetical protein VFX89_09490 [Gammaproteobacteria bacterium]|nr:hypothetical protein [Gammaproteobacteria bacterium]
MDRQHIRDAQVVERYLSGTLTAAEEQAFEEAYLADPRLLEELEVAERLRAGLKDSSAAGVAASPATPRARWRELVSSPRYGLAASLVAVAALASSTVLLVQNQSLRAGAPLAAQTHTRLLQLVSVRGADNPNEIAAPAPGEWTVLLVDPGFGDYDVFTAVLVRAGGAELLRLDGLTPTYEGQLALGMPGGLLVPGRYEIRLSGGNRDWPATQKLDELGRTPLTVTARP